MANQGTYPSLLVQDCVERKYACSEYRRTEKNLSYRAYLFKETETLRLDEKKRLNFSDPSLPRQIVYEMRELLIYDIRRSLPLIIENISFQSCWMLAMQAF